MNEDIAPGSIFLGARGSNCLWVHTARYVSCWSPLVWCSVEIFRMGVLHGLFLAALLIKLGYLSLG